MGKIKTKTTVANTTQPTASTDLESIENLFQKELNAAGAGCASCITFFKNVKIPQDYQNVLGWLALIGTQEALAEINKQPIDTVAITTALVVSTQYAATSQSNLMASAALNIVVTSFIARFKLDLKNEVNDADLIKYCQDNQIAIPVEIAPLLNPKKMQSIIEVSPGKLTMSA
jgi:hypothetical protein